MDDYRKLGTVGKEKQITWYNEKGEAIEGGELVFKALYFVLVAVGSLVVLAAFLFILILFI